MKNRLFGKNVQLFGANHKFSAFGSTFQQKVAKSASFRGKAWKIVHSAKMCIFFEQTTMFRCFHQLLSKKFQKVPNLAKKTWKVVDFSNTCNFFEETTMCRRLGKLFRKKMKKVPHFVKTHVKSSIWQKLATFSSKPPRFAVWVNVSAKSATFFQKAWKNVDLAKICNFLEQTTMSRRLGQFLSKKLQKVRHLAKSMRNRRFGQNVQLFGANYHVSTLRSTFQQKVAKSASGLERAWKIVNCVTTCKFFEETTLFGRLEHLFSKKLQKVPHLAKKHEKSSISPKCKTFSSKPPRFSV